MRIWYAFFAGFVLLGLTFYLSFMTRCDGEQRWETYTGVLQDLDIECSICCHVRSYFVINGTWVPVLNCEEELEFIPLNHTYTIYCSPASESYAISRPYGEPQCFWSIKIDRIVENGYEIWKG